MALPTSPQYGDKKRLADLGLGSAETPITGGVRLKPPTGRPPVAGPPPTVAPQQNLLPTAEDEAIMRQYAEDERAYNDAMSYQGVEGAGAWTQLLLEMADYVRKQSGLELNNRTPNWNLE